MRDSCSISTNLDRNGGYPFVFLSKSNQSESSGDNILPEFSWIVERSLGHRNDFYAPKISSIQNAFNGISRFTGAIVLWFTSKASADRIRRMRGISRGEKNKKFESCAPAEDDASSYRQNVVGLHFAFHSNVESVIPVLIAKAASSSLRRLWKEVESQAIPVLSLAAAIFPPFKNTTSEIRSDPLSPEKIDQGITAQKIPRVGDCQGFSAPAISNITFTKDSVEPITGIKFPILLDNSSGGETSSSLASEVLVGTGSRTMRIIKIKSLKLYAFGLYVHLDTVCKKLGPKYASMSPDELKNCSHFYEDLLREDIGMTIRLVVNCNGIKIDIVRDAFEKSLRNRLQKMNPNTDYHCLRAFASYFTQDIPLSVGTTIDFRQTADGQLITQIEGKQIGAVRSKDLCRAFFDMYIGDLPVSEQAKQEVAGNVAGLISRC